MIKEENLEKLKDDTGNIIELPEADINNEVEVEKITDKRSI